MYSYNSEIPVDEERKRTEMEKTYRETYDDLEKKGLLSAGPVPNSLLINAHLVMRGNQK